MTDNNRISMDRMIRCAGMSREQIEAVDALEADLTAEHFWEILPLFEGFSFVTSKGLEYTYRIKGGELFVSRKDKSITRSTVDLAFARALELGRLATGPKKLGVFGASYLYPIFLRLGVIRLSECSWDK